MRAIGQKKFVDKKRGHLWFAPLKLRAQALRRAHVIVQPRFMHCTMVTLLLRLLGLVNALLVVAALCTRGRWKAQESPGSGLEFRIYFHNLGFGIPFRNLGFESYFQYLGFEICGIFLNYPGFPGSGIGILFLKSEIWDWDFIFKSWDWALFWNSGI